MTNLDPRTDDRLSAYLDDELAPDERAEFEVILQARPEYQEALERLKSLRHDFGELPAHTAPETLLENIVDRLDASEQASGPLTGSISDRRAQAGWHRLLTVAAAVGALAACLVLITQFATPRDVEIAKNPAGAVARDPLDGGARGDLTVKEAAEAGKPSGLEGELDAVLPESMRLESVAGEGDELAGDELDDERSNRVRETSPGLVGDRSSDDAPAVPAEDAIRDASPMRRMGETRAAPRDVPGDDIPEILIQVHSEDAYDQILMVMSQVELQPETPEDELRQGGYRAVQTQLHNRQQSGGRQLEPMVTQVIEVTSTANDIAQLVELARVQGAEVANTPQLASQVAQRGIRKQTESAENALPSTTINNWQQIAWDAEAKSTLGETRFGVDADVANEAMTLQIDPNQAEDQTMRWRITIQPAADRPVGQPE